MALTKINYTGQGVVPHAKMPSGGVLQVQYSDIGGSAVGLSSATMTSLGSLAITPKFSNSKILVQIINHIYIVGVASDAWRGVLIEIRRDSTAIGGSDAGKYGEAAHFTTDTDRMMLYSNRFVVDTPSTTNAVTYSMYGASLGGVATMDVNNPSYGTQGKILLMEIAA
jgi:hypothetical protein